MWLFIGVTSHANALPLDHGIMVAPSGRLPSCRPHETHPFFDCLWPLLLLLLPPPMRLRFNRYLSVCLSVCLLASQRIRMTFSGTVGNGPLNKWLYFGVDPDQGSGDRDTGKTCLGGGMHCLCASSYYYSASEVFDILALYKSDYYCYYYFLVFLLSVGVTEGVLKLWWWWWLLLLL